jgi:choline dehydrogenase-like flavoprotein
MKITETADVLVIGSGMGGATFAAGLAPTGAKILLLERGQHLRDCEAVRDARAIFQRGQGRPSTPAITTTSAAIPSSTGRS